jgi:hypothetical protein
MLFCYLLVSLGLFCCKKIYSYILRILYVYCVFTPVQYCTYSSFVRTAVSIRIHNIYHESD